ncbi:MAG TPA: glycosyltransferase, partial [Planctomycetota bacterium]|nr:glycosyltransferase [Planctomycetota bacterium]
MNVTVAICTWNRAELLRQTLAEIAKMRIPAGARWEVLVVDNNSTDATPSVVASFEGRLPARRVFEPRPGKSHALNRAAREARGDYILWTDDDALVAEDWLVEYGEAFRRWPDAAVFGGAVEPWFAAEPPAWLRRAWPRVAHAYAARDPGPETRPIEPHFAPFGVNLAVRASEQRRFLYDPALGPRPNSALRGEETSLVRAMLEAGVRGWWVPTARVRHYIPAERLTIGYLRGFFFGQGQFWGLTMERPPA